MVEFNKMMVMIPVMLAARKLDSENVTTLLWIRIAYGVIQTFIVCIIFYTYYCAIQLQNDTTIIYVPPPPSPFGDTNGKKKYTETTFGKQCVTTARSLIGSTLFGIAMTVGFHYYKGMLMGLAIQTVMAPFSLIENPLVKALLLSSTKSIVKSDKIFNEKYSNELTNDDEIVDETGNVITKQQTITATQQKQQRKNDGTTLYNESSKELSLEETMLDTWDAGAKANISSLMSMLTVDNVNTATTDDKWTSLMILCGLGSTPGTGSAIKQLIAMGADTTKIDIEGWNCLHWAAFHNSIIAAKEICTNTTNNNNTCNPIALLQVTDKEGSTPIETALKEGNTSIAEHYEQILKAAASVGSKTDTEPKKDK